MLHQTPIPSAGRLESARLELLMERRVLLRSESISAVRRKESSGEVIPVQTRSPSDLKVGWASYYLPLPERVERTGIPEGIACWRIELHGLWSDSEPLGIDVLDDVVIGRGPDADLDLDGYGAYRQAVSRRHALLRPSQHRLHILDIGSTNGTTCKSIPLGRSMAYTVKGGDVIMLGLLTFTIHIIDGPFTLTA